MKSTEKERKMPTLAEKAEAARATAAAKSRRDAERRAKENTKRILPLAAEKMSKLVGRRVAQRALAVKATGHDKSGKPEIVFDYDGTEFSYGEGDGLHVRKPCPHGCGATISDGYTYDLSSVGKFLKKTQFHAHEHVCYESAVRGLQREAESYARKLNETPYGLLVRAAETPFATRRVF